jgi:hypothetical protein
MSKSIKNTTQQFNTIKSQLTLVKDKSKQSDPIWLKLKGPSALDFKKLTDSNQKEQLTSISNLSYPNAKEIISSLNLEVPVIISEKIKTNSDSLLMKRCNSSPLFYNPYWTKQNYCLNKEIKPEIENIIEINREDKNKSFLINYLNLVIFFLLALFFLGFILIIWIKKSFKTKNCKETHCNINHTSKKGLEVINQNKGKSKS